jgi:hypothetical protein
MSVEWYKFRLGNEGTPGFLENLAKQQSEAFRKAVNWPLPGQELSDQERSQAAQEYLSTSSAMIPFLSFVGQGKKVESKPIAHIAYNDTFPPEWREEAKSTLLPQVLPALLRKWEGYAQDLRMGYYEDYIHRLYMFEDYNLLGRGYQGWHQLLVKFLEISDAAMENPAEWAQTEAARRTLEEIKADPVLPLQPELPVFSADLRDMDMRAATRTAFDGYKKELERLVHQIIAWNRCAPEAEKLRIPSFIPVQVRMRQRLMASREWLHPFLEWCRQVVDEGCGLFLAA